MKKLITTVTATLVLISNHSPCYAQTDDDLWEAKGPHVRIKRNDQDGSYVRFKRNPDDRKLIKTTLDANDTIKMRAVYYRNPKGFLTVGKIYDGQGAQLYRVRYGYHKETGQLLAEDMFDARVQYHYPGITDAKGNLIEMPVRRIYYFYDTDGNQSKAISLVPNKGADAKKVFGKTRKKLDMFSEEKFDPSMSTRPDQNPFDEGRRKKQKQGQ